MEKVILDTNFLMLPYTEGLDIFTELERILPKHELLIPEEVVEELKRIIEDKENTGKDRKAASIALQLIERKKIKKIAGEGSVDDQIVEYTRENKEAIACTNDRALRKRIKENNTKTIGMRARKYLSYV